MGEFLFDPLASQALAPRRFVLIRGFLTSCTLSGKQKERRPEVWISSCAGCPWQKLPFIVHAFLLKPSGKINSATTPAHRSAQLAHLNGSTSASYDARAASTASFNGDIGWLIWIELNDRPRIACQTRFARMTGLAGFEIYDWAQHVVRVPLYRFQLTEK